jgi:hypothetical protein
MERKMKAKGFFDNDGYWHGEVVDFFTGQRFLTAADWLIANGFPEDFTSRPGESLEEAKRRLDGEPK